MSNTFLTIFQRTAQAIGDYISHPVTTALAANTSVISTHLLKYRSVADKFNDWYIYVTDKANAGVNNWVSDDDGTNTLTVRTTWTVEAVGTDYATFQLHKYNPDNYHRAIQIALRQLYPTLHIPLNDSTLISGNILPNAHFEDWVSTSYPDFCSLTNATSAETTTAGLHWGGVSSALVTASAADGYMYFDSNTYPPLLDYMGQSVTFKAWAYPSVANDAFLTIYTLKADGTEQTLNSTTTCPASKFTLLELEDQTLNDDLVRIQFRFRVHTSGATTYFDNSRAIGLNGYKYLLPTDFRNGHLSEVSIQTSGLADDPCDDLHISSQEKILNWHPEKNSINGTNYEFLRLPFLQPSEYKLYLRGYKPLESLSADSDTLSIDDPDLELVIAKSALQLFKIEKGLVSTLDKTKFDDAIGDWEREVMRLTPRFSMARPVETFKYREF